MNVDKQATQTCFVDSNIWLYAFMEGQDADKTALAQNLVRRDYLVVSTQIINEVCVNPVKKAKLEEARIQNIIEDFNLKYTVVRLDKDILLKASELRERYKFSYWDSLVVACALAADASVLYSEDMDTSLVIEGRLRITNPLVH